MVLDKFFDVEGNVHTPNDISQVKFRPAVYILVQNDKKEFLMILNGASTKWEISGGGLEIGEDLVECGIREVKEETGYDIKIESELPFYIEKDLSYSRSKKEFEHSIHFFYKGKLISENREEQHFAKGEKILKVKFFSLDELSDLDVAFWHKKALKKYLELVK